MSEQIPIIIGEITCIIVIVFLIIRKEFRKEEPDPFMLFVNFVFALFYTVITVGILSFLL